MASNQNHPLCKTLCISTCKTLAKHRAKNVYNHPFKLSPRAKLHFPTHFSRFSHRLSRRLPTPQNNPTFPLFHNPYYYNYKIFI